MYSSAACALESLLMVRKSYPTLAEVLVFVETVSDAATARNWLPLSFQTVSGISNGLSHFICMDLLSCAGMCTGVHVRAPRHLIRHAVYVDLASKSFFSTDTPLLSTVSFLLPQKTGFLQCTQWVPSHCWDPSPYIPLASFLPGRVTGTASTHRASGFSQRQSCLSMPGAASSQKYVMCSKLMSGWHTPPSGHTLLRSSHESEMR